MTMKTNLIEVYIQEVTRRLPEKMRSDIALELRSTIEDMLPNHHTEEDVKDVLNQLGNPAVLANGYKDQPMHLIGPRYFDVYMSLLKMIVPIAAVVSLITIITKYFIGFSGEEAILNSILTLVGEGIGTMIEVGIQVFFWLTITFALLERFDKDKEQLPLTSGLEKWTAEDLKNVAYISKQKTISKLEIFGSLMWTAIWVTLYFYANQIIGVYEGGGGQLEFVMPALNQDVLQQYGLIVLIIAGLEIAFALYKLLKEQWTKRMAIGNTVLEVISTIVFIIILIKPNFLSEEFVVYITNMFTITKEQFNLWLIGGTIIILIITAAVSIYDGFKKVNIR